MKTKNFLNESLNMKNAITPDNGSTLARQWTDNGPANPLAILTLFLMLFSFGVGNAWGDTTGQQTSFTAISGKVNGSNDITYSCIQAGGSSAPVINSNAIRLYQNSTTYAGGVIRIYAASGCTINSVTIGSSMATTVGYQTKEVNESELKTAYSGSSAISANGTKTYDGLSTTVISIACLGTSSSSRLYINKLSVTYTKAASTYTVTYNGNSNTSGSVPTDATAYSSGATVTVKGNTGSLVRTGYTFGGWNTQADGNGTNYAAGSGTFTITANTTLYAKWNPTYTVTYNGNGNTSGSVPTDATAYNSGATVTVKSNTGSLAKTGWTFAGWNTNATSTGTDRAASSTFSITANTTLYAKWTCTVTWSVNGVTNVYSEQTVTYNSSGSKVSSVPAPDPASYCGQVFAGWTTEAYSGNSAPPVLFKTVGDSPNLNSTGSVTFYAVFADYAN